MARWCVPLSLALTPVRIPVAYLAAAVHARTAPLRRRPPPHPSPELSPTILPPTYNLLHPYISLPPTPAACAQHYAVDASAAGRLRGGVVMEESDDAYRRRQREELARKRTMEARESMSKYIKEELAEVLSVQGDGPSLPYVETVRIADELEEVAQREGFAAFLGVMRLLGMHPHNLVPNESGFQAFVLAPNDTSMSTLPKKTTGDPVAMLKFVCSHIVLAPKSTGFFGSRNGTTGTLRSIQGTVHHCYGNGDIIDPESVTRIGTNLLSEGCVHGFAQGKVVVLPGILPTINPSEVVPEQVWGTRLVPSPIFNMEDLDVNKVDGRVGPHTFGMNHDDALPQHEFRINPERGPSSGGTVVWLYCSGLSPFTTKPPTVTFGSLEATHVHLIGPGFIECHAPAIDMGNASSEWPVTVSVHDEHGNEPVLPLRFTYYKHTASGSKRGRSEVDDEDEEDEEDEDDEEEEEEEEEEEDEVQKTHVRKRQCGELMERITKTMKAYSARARANAPSTSTSQPEDVHTRLSSPYTILDERHALTNWNVLHYFAALGANVELAAVLSKPQCPLRALDSKGLTPLLVALLHGNWKAAQLMFKAEQMQDPL